MYRHPDQVTNTVTRTVTVMAPAPAPIMLAHEDSVSAAETRRLRDRDAAFRVLRDSLNNAAQLVTHGEPRAKRVGLRRRKGVRQRVSVRTRRV